MSKLALFDFDGTITDKDSFLEFIKFYSSTTQIVLGICILLPRMVLYKFGFIKNWQAKQYVLRWFFKGESVEKFKATGEKFVSEIVPKILKEDALKKIEEHKRNGDRVILISASAEHWLSPWTKSIGIELIGTRLEEVNGKITGKIAGHNCYGPQKVIRLKEQVDLSGYEEIYAYGDSRGDKEMLSLADHSHYQFFKK